MLAIEGNNQLNRSYHVMAKPKAISARQEVTTDLERAIHSLGFEYVTYWRMWPAAGPRIPLFANNFPPKYIKQHIDLGLDCHDPMAHRACQSAAPFLWAELRRSPDLTPRQRKVIDDRAKFGLRSGGVIPIHGPGATRALLAVASSMDEREFATLFTMHRDALIQLAYYAHERYESTPLAKRLNPRLQLTTPQVQALSLLAQGYSQSQIATAMNRKIDATKGLLKRAYDKLDADNRVHAVALAIWHGLICPFGAVRATEVHAGLPLLAAEEIEALTLAAHGYTWIGVASVTGVQADTVRQCWRGIRHKLGVSTTTHAVALAMHHRLILP